jgi:hypothetical protein
VDDDWPGAGTLLVSRYRLISRLETGGMAQIWKADDELLGRPVALKLPATSQPRTAEILHLAWKEASTTARLSHPRIAAVHDYREGTRPDGSVVPFVVMELLDGESLAARLERGPVAWAEAARIGVAVAEALAAAHASRVVHRDIKPGNVMLTPTGVKILDFGISAVTGDPDDDETGATFGTPAYVSPERLDGRPAEPATDVYGLGAVLFEAVTGDPPYPVDTWAELAVARAAGPAPLPEDLPAAFRDVVTRCLNEDPAGRPTAAQVREDLAALVPPEDAPDGERDTGSYRSGRAPALTVPMETPQRRRPLVRAAAAGALLAAAGAIVVAGAWNRADVEADPPVAVPAAPPSTPAAPPSDPATTEPSPAPTATTSSPPSRDEVVRRVRRAVESAQDTGDIRPDVAADLLNLIRPLSTAEAGDVAGRVADLRRKIRDRVAEGSLPEEQGDALQARLADLAGAST